MNNNINQINALKESVNFEVKYAKNLVKNIALRSNLSAQNCVTELVDNGKEAAEKVGEHEIEIAMAAPNLPNGINLMVRDNGCGMNENDLRDLFFTIGNGDQEKSGVHAQIGGRIAISRLCEAEGAYAEIITRKRGHMAIKVIWDGISEANGEVMEDSSIPYGTTILIHGSTLTTDDADKYKAYASLRYFEAINNGLNITINGQKIDAEDPLYRDFEDIDDISEINVYTNKVIGPKDGQEYEVKHSIRDLSMFYITDKNEYKHGFTPHSWDVEKNNEGETVRCLINDHSRAGFYVKVGDMVIVPGGVVSPYIDRVTHAQMNGKRVLLEIPEKLAEQLNFQMNKSAGFVDFNRLVSLAQLRADMKNHFETLIQAHVSRARDEHEEKVRGYRSEKNIPNGKKKVTFTANNSLMLPKQTFAVIDNDGESVVFNQDSTLLKPLKSNNKMFGITANVAESMYIAFIDALQDAHKFQPKWNRDTNPKATAITSRDQTIDKIKELFIERFMALGSE